jgi:tetratricopeptide (TPR) repeat protein
VDQYLYALDLIEEYSGIHSVDQTRLACFLNLSLAYLKLTLYHKVITYADLAISMEPNNLKAYYRKGEAYFALKDYVSAKASYEAALVADPANAEAKAKLAQINNVLHK